MSILDDKEKEDLKDVAKEYIKYDFYKWLIGGIIAAVVCIVGFILVAVMIIN